VSEDLRSWDDFYFIFFLVRIGLCARIINFVGKIIYKCNLSITQIGLLSKLSAGQTDLYKISDQHILCVVNAVQHQYLSVLSTEEHLEIFLCHNFNFCVFFG
jgi:hypothetical protein